MEEIDTKFIINTNNKALKADGAPDIEIYTTKPVTDELIIKIADLLRDHNK